MSGKGHSPGSSSPVAKVGLAHARSLEALSRRNRLRALSPREGWDFSSNDYLGLAGSGALSGAIAKALEEGVAIGSGGSRLLRGNDQQHVLLEEEAAKYFKAEAALYFASGFAANAALFSTLPMRGDLIVHDALIHASVHDGVQQSRAAVRIAAHNDVDAFEDAIATWRAEGGRGRVWIAVESLYSMDGDIAPLGDLIAVADRHDGILVIDEAHATGVLGPNGRGLGADLEGRHNVVSLHTCGKALGVMGGLVLGPRVLIDFMINRCRPFIYSTAPSPLMAAGVRAALKIVAKNDGGGASEGGGHGSLRGRHRALVKFAGDQLTERCGIEPTGTHIQPIIVGPDERAVGLALRLQKRGFDVRAIRPPTVPEGTARLRVPLTLNVSCEVIAEFVQVLSEELGDRGDRIGAVGS
ncbi:MAG: 8-amino-7-oxononanoate synthase [Alphaproteobacteria bacterium]|nr:8-amino-7-oxononanoate synthase [Alphaproteobacteria bacterium]